MIWHFIILSSQNYGWKNCFKLLLLNQLFGFTENRLWEMKRIFMFKKWVIYWIWRNFIWWQNRLRCFKELLKDEGGTKFTWFMNLKMNFDLELPLSFYASPIVAWQLNSMTMSLVNRLFSFPLITNITATLFSSGWKHQKGFQTFCNYWIFL